MITTVIPTYRRPKLLPRAIESVLSQTYGDLNVRVMDNASNDETEAVVQEYSKKDKRVSYVKNPTNVGPVNNMIKGVASLDSNFYSLLNDDDFLLPTIHEQAMAAFKKDQRIGFACARIIKADLMSEKLMLLNKEWASGVYDPSITLTSKMLRSHFVTTGVIFRREMRDRIGCFDLSGNDRLYMTMASAAAPFSVLTKTGAVLTMHGEAYSYRIGIPGADASLLQASQQQALKRVLDLDIPIEQRAHLLMLTINSHALIFDIKRFSSFMATREYSDAILDLSPPSARTYYGIVNRVFELVPRPVRPAIRLCVAILGKIKSLELVRPNASDWVPFSHAMTKFFRESTVSPSQFATALDEMAAANSALFAQH